MIMGRLSRLSPDEFDQHVIADSAKHGPPRENLVHFLEEPQQPLVLPRPTFNVGRRYEEPDCTNGADPKPWRKCVAHLTNRRISHGYVDSIEMRNRFSTDAPERLGEVRSQRVPANFPEANACRHADHDCAAGANKPSESHCDR